jgi:hypothetical protein
MMPQDRTKELTNSITYALQTCFADHPEWFASGDFQAVADHMQTSLKPLLDIPLQLSFNDGYLACAKHIIPTPSA